MDYQSLSIEDADYPALLRFISDPPKILFWTGEAPKRLLNRPRVAIIGSRNVSQYGSQVTSQLASDLASAGVVIVSGLAIGVDAIAHRAALEAGGTALAVPPCSLDKIYSAINAQLAKQIVATGGTLITEYGSGTPFMNKYNFVARNRIISGLSDAVIITEAAISSGSLHTAEFALQQRREVMVVSRNINSPTSESTNNLLKIGASPITSANDVFSILGMSLATAVKKREDNQTEQLVLDLLESGIHESSELLHKSELTPTDFNQTLTMLEITCKIRAGGANTWY